MRKSVSHFLQGEKIPGHANDKKALRGTLYIEYAQRKRGKHTKVQEKRERKHNSTLDLDLGFVLILIFRCEQ